MSIESKLEELKIKLPKPKDPVGSYVASKIVGNHFTFRTNFN